MFLNGMFNASLSDSKITTEARNDKMIVNALYNPEIISEMASDISKQLNDSENHLILKQLDDDALDILINLCQKEKTNRELNDPDRNRS